MNKWTKDEHSLSQTLEKLDNDPNVVFGLTGNELLIIAGSLQLLSLFSIFPIFTILTGLWIFGLGLSMVVGVVLIIYVGNRVAKMKEREGGAGDIVWINIKIRVCQILSLESGVMLTKERWSCDRSRRANKK